MKKRVLALLLAMAMLMCSGCAAEPKDVQLTEGGFTITLTEKFEKMANASYDVVYNSPKVLVMAVNDTYEELEAAGLTKGTLDTYAQLCKTNHGGLDTVSIKQSDKYPYFEYEQEVEGTKYSYYGCFFQGSNGYWAVTFATMPEDYADQKANIEKWASSIQVQ